MEKCNKSKSSLELDELDIFIIALIITLALLIIGICLFKHFDHKKYKYKYIAYIKLPGKESCIKEYKYYDIFSYGSMITLELTDGSKITTSTRNVTLVKSKKGINNESKYILK